MVYYNTRAVRMLLMARVCVYKMGHKGANFAKDESRKSS